MLNCMQSRVDDEIRVRTNQLGKEESLETFLNSDLAMQYITERIKGNAHE